MRNASHVIGAVRIGLLLGIVLAVAAVCLLMTEHVTHISRWLPYALILACPLMHLFGHHHHGGHHHDSSQGSDRSKDVPPN